MLELRCGVNQIETDMDQMSIKSLREMAKAIDAPDNARIRISAGDYQEEVTDENFLVDTTRQIYQEHLQGNPGANVVVDFIGRPGTKA